MKLLSSDEELQLCFLCHPFGWENFRSIVSGKRNFWHSEFSAMKVSTHEITIYFIFRILLVSLNFRKHLMPEQKDISCLKQFMKMKSFIFRGKNRQNATIGQSFGQFI